MDYFTDFDRYGGIIVTLGFNFMVLNQNKYLQAIFKMFFGLFLILKLVSIQGDNLYQLR